MEKTEHVLVGLDLDVHGQSLSLGCRRAVERALWVSETTGARIDFVHSTAGDRFVEQEGRVYAVIHEGLSPGARAEMDALVKQASSGGKDSQLTISEEKPWLAITQEAMRRDTDLVLIGKHNEEEDGSRLGSVAKKVLRKCPGSVWVVEPRAPRIPGTVLAATDLSDVGLRALRYAGFVAAKTGAELHVVHAFQLSMADQMNRELHDDDFESVRLRAEKGVRDQMELAGCPQAKMHVGCSTPVRAILGGAESLSADLLVLGTVSRGGIPGFLEGNTAEKVLPKAGCSLLTIKPEDFVSPVSPPN